MRLRDGMGEAPEMNPDGRIAIQTGPRWQKMAIPTGWFVNDPMYFQIVQMAQMANTESRLGRK